MCVVCVFCVCMCVFVVVCVCGRTCVVCLCVCVLCGVNVCCERDRWRCVEGVKCVGGEG